MTLQERVIPLDLIEGTVVAKRNDSKEPHPQSPFLRLFPNMHVVKSVFPVTLNIFATNLTPTKPLNLVKSLVYRLAFWEKTYLTPCTFGKR